MHHKNTDIDVVKMLEYLHNNIKVEFRGQIVQQTIGISVGTNCASLLPDLFCFTRMRQRL